MNEMNELDWVKQTQDGDKKAFGQLYEAYVPKIYRYCYQKTLQKSIAEDITSEIFFKALDRIDRFDPQKSSFKTWLYTLARNTIIDHYRTFNETEDIEDVWGIESSDDVAEEVSQKMEYQELHKHMKSLSNESRDYLILRFWNELTFKEIAEITGKSEASIKMNVQRSIKALKAHFLLFILLNHLT